MSEWWTGLSPSQATVDCGGEEHRLRWEAGILHMLDHDDPEGERTLAALGGERCACVEFLDAWERHRDDVRALVLARRGAADHLVPQEDQGAGQALGPRPAQGGSRAAGAPTGFVGGASVSVSVFSSGAGRSAHPAGPQAGRTSKAQQADLDLIALLGLGGGLPDRLVASVAAIWTQRIASRERGVARVRPALQAALYGRLLAALDAWLGASGQGLRLRMIGERGRPRLEAGDSAVIAELPFGWLPEVWCRGLATIGGRFCLSADTDDSRTWRLLTVGPDLGTPAVVTLQLPG